MLRFVVDWSRKVLVLGKCAVVGCANDRYRNKKLCTKHLRQRQKEINPVRYTYDMLKQNAKRRKKSFTLTFEYFKKWCKRTKYIELKGRLSGSATIDRKGNSKGYENGNIRILTNAANIRKEIARRDWEATYYSKIKELPIDTSDIVNKKPISKEKAPF